MRTAVVVAGGRSTRFEAGDKAVADFAGTPMIRRVADRLAAVVDELVVNCRDDQRATIETALDGFSLPVCYAVDEDADRGPMAGITVGLGAATGEYAAVVACDMPFVDPPFVDYLFGCADGHDAAVPRPDEWYQTTQAVYRTGPMAAACDRALARGETKILGPLSDLDWVVVDDERVREAAAADTFRNVNTDAELRAAAAEFRRTD
jgi:molybdopterin-guanine dinucleotide biosynthesis protein A